MLQSDDGVLTVPSNKFDITENRDLYIDKNDKNEILMNK